MLLFISYMSPMMIQMIQLTCCENASSEYDGRVVRKWKIEGGGLLKKYKHNSSYQPC